VLVLAKAAKIFGAPVILTAIESEGFSGNITPQLLDLFPSQTPIERSSLNSWENKELVAAAKSTARAHPNKTYRRPAALKRASRDGLGRVHTACGGRDAPRRKLGCRLDPCRGRCGLRRTKEKRMSMRAMKTKNRRNRQTEGRL
ncbi:MAG: hydrolase, partial [Actinomycetia bacterium]|nr:hydrolase [Actinomycetes bacterium]